jgi:glycerophosphoryl diester phosphodiesterase
MTLVIAHRGFSGAAPENTLPAFRKALGAGCDGLELDLRLTREGKVAILHDATVDRTTNGSGKVRSMTMTRLRRLDAGAWFDAPFRGARIPTLEEILRLGRRCELLILDTKDRDPSWLGRFPLLRKLPVLVASEYDGFLRGVRRRFPWVHTALTAERAADLARAARLGCTAIDPRARLVDAAFMRRARALGLEVYPWTVNAPKEALRLARLGVDGVITNHPGPVREVLRAV